LDDVELVRLADLDADPQIVEDCIRQDDRLIGEAELLLSEVDFPVRRFCR
jgi:hypothetical protein